MSAIKHPDDGPLHRLGILDAAGLGRRVIPMPPKRRQQFSEGVVKSQLDTQNVFSELALGDGTQQAQSWHLDASRLQKRPIEPKDVAVLY